MKAQGHTSKNPFVESFTYPGNKRRILVALFGVACGLTIVFYTALFASLTFLRGPMRVDDTTAEILVGIGSLASATTLIYFGWLSDKVGRKKPIVWGYVAALVLLFPLFWGLAALANPALSAAQRDNPIVLSGPRCEYDPFASVQDSECGRLMAELTDRGTPYSVRDGEVLAMTLGSERIALEDVPGSEANRAAVAAALDAAGYNPPDSVPPPLNMVGIVLIVLVLGALTGATYGPVAALLSEMFPPRIRYSSMSIPYHIGAGYFGGFLPLISGYIVARTGDIFAGNWYTWVLLIVALVVALWGLPGGPPRDFADEIGR
jgi:MFS family permease